MMSETLRKNAAVAVDLVVLTIRSERLCALVVKRGIVPFKGRWALPGGFVLPDEGLAEAAVRELEEETGLAELPVHLEQLATYGRPRRDPRGRVISVAHLALAPDLPTPRAGSDAAAARWTPVDELLAEPRGLAFDHQRILADGVERARAKLEYTPLGAAFCPEEFTISELRHVYEVVWGKPLDPRNFHRKATGTPGFVTPTGRQTTRAGGRPAQLYRQGNAAVLYPPLLRQGT
ncbi:MAG: NUDIX hydrolase [Actinomycetota bacterium]